MEEPYFFFFLAVFFTALFAVFFTAFFLGAMCSLLASVQTDQPAGWARRWKVIVWRARAQGSEP